MLTFVNNFQYIKNEKMETYKAEENWDTFYEYIVENNFNPDDICYAHRGNEILVRTCDIKILEIIGKTYQLIPCQPPVFYINDGWVLVGNPNLFD